MATHGRGSGERRWRMITCIYLLLCDQPKLRTPESHVQRLWTFLGQNDITAFSSKTTKDGDLQQPKKSVWKALRVQTDLKILYLQPWRAVELVHPLQAVCAFSSAVTGKIGAVFKCIIKSFRDLGWAVCSHFIFFLSPAKCCGTVFLWGSRNVLWATKLHLTFHSLWWQCSVQYKYHAVKIPCHK